MKVESGAHLGTVREFIQRHAINGSDVRWGSDEVLRFTGVTVGELEQLAQRIKDAVMRELEIQERGKL